MIGLVESNELLGIPHSTMDQNQNVLDQQFSTFFLPSFFQDVNDLQKKVGRK